MSSLVTRIWSARAALAHRLHRGLSRVSVAVDGVDGRHHRADPVEPFQGRLEREGLQHRLRVGQARGLDHHVVEGRDLVVLAGVVEAVQGADQVAGARCSKGSRCRAP